MAAERLSRLQRRMLQWVYEVEASSGWHMSPSYFDLRRALGGNKGNMSVSLHNLEAKGLIQVYRTSGGQASSVWLTKEGKNRVSKLKKVLIKNDPKIKQQDTGMN
jgi:DNA-binding MarR family transcriptional regulator